MKKKKKQLSNFIIKQIINLNFGNKYQQLVRINFYDILNNSETKRRKVMKNYTYAN